VGEAGEPTPRSNPANGNTGTHRYHRVPSAGKRFTSDTPDLALPTALAERLGLWPRPGGGAVVVTLETGGGPVEAYVVPQAVLVRVVTRDRVSREVLANALVNPYIGEVLVSDSLTEELGIQMLYPRRGVWKFVDEDVLRESEDCGTG
jgi:hypothetical protein